MNPVGQPSQLNKFGAPGTPGQKDPKLQLQRLKDSEWFSSPEGQIQFGKLCSGLLSADGTLSQYHIAGYTVINAGNSLRIHRNEDADTGYKISLSLAELKPSLLQYIQPTKQYGNNYNLAALSTVCQIFCHDIPVAHNHDQGIYETTTEKKTRTPKGFVEVAKEFGLSAAAKVISSFKEFQQCIADAVSAGKPLIAPFLVDNGLYLTGEGVRTFSNHNYSVMISKRYYGKPIAESDSVTNLLCKPIENLINKSKTFDDFQQSVGHMMSLYKQPIPMPKEAGARESEKAVVRQLSISMGLANSTQLSGMTGPEFKENIDRPIREAQMAICTIGRSTIEQMSKATFESIKNGSKSILDLVVNGDPLHSCLITSYNPMNDQVTIAHWGNTHTTTSAALYASSQLLPDELKGVLYTFHPASVGPSDLSGLYS